ncbi:hypothetical protein N7470_000238 [Penicillium chermesinum]|nr:hypothetical protein N7470_000238 [Penicillium chermesinum]
MTSQREDSIPHELRTAAEPRQQGLYPVRLTRVEQANPSIRLLQFGIPAHTDNVQPFTFQPGQWLDVHIPSITNAGGFTITSTPADAQGASAHVELAVQDSPSNPAAAWLWKPEREIINQEVNIRVGGSFTWPPSGIESSLVKNVLLVAGGVGINPLISILSHLHNEWQGPHQLSIHFLYSSRLPQGHESLPLGTILDQILFVPRIREILKSQKQSRKLNISLQLFLTDLPAGRLSQDGLTDFTIHSRRINKQDIDAVVAGGDPSQTVSYIADHPA